MTAMPPGTKIVGGVVILDPDWIDVSPDELVRGYVKPFRVAYQHHECGGVTMLDKRIASRYALRPHEFPESFCSACGDWFPSRSFSWVGYNRRVGD